MSLKQNIISWKLVACITIVISIIAAILNTNTILSDYCQIQIDAPGVCSRALAGFSLSAGIATLASMYLLFNRDLKNKE